MIGISRSVSGSSTCLPTRCGVALVIGIDRDGGVAQHRLRPGRGDDQVFVLPDDRIAQIIKLVVLLLVLDLEVGERRMAAGAPVDHVFVAIDIALLVEGREDAVDRLDVTLVEGEALALVIEGAAHPLQLVDDGGTVLAAPLPDPLLELFAADLLARQPLAGQLLLDLVLGGDAGVVGAADPEGVLAPHAAPGVSAGPGWKN